MGSGRGRENVKVVVLGAGGMLGHKMIQELSKRGHNVVSTLHGSLQDAPYSRIDLFTQVEIIDNFDAADGEKLQRTLADLRPDAVVNCVGVIKQRKEAKDAIPSLQLNALLPHQLALWGERDGYRVVHFSTDCVFSGSKGNYKLSDPPDAQDLYGRSKLMGEISYPNSLTLRTSIIGRELTHNQSLVEWFLAQKGPQLNGYTKAVYSGMTTLTMGKLVAWLLETKPELHGLFQAVSEKIDKFRLLLLLKEAFHKEVEVQPFDYFVCDRSMCGEAFEQETGWVAPPWSAQIQEMADDPTPYERWK